MAEEETHDLAKQPHDAFFKDFFSDPTHASSFFRDHLPGTLPALVQWDSLKLVPGSFVKRSLRQAHSDLLFTAPIGSDKDLLLHLIFEHQTTVDPAMPLRLLAYQIEILLTHYKKYGLPLPPVVGYVLHQGPEKWTVSQRFEDLFELSPENLEALLPFIPKFCHGLYDLSQAEPQDSERDAELRVALQLMKLARTVDLTKFVEWFIEHVATGAATFSGPFFNQILHYALHGDPNLDVEEISNTLKTSLDPKETAMSLAQLLKSEGRSEGRSEGKTEGILVGKIQVLEELMGGEVSTPNDLASLEIAELEERFRKVEARYQAQFKRK